MLLPIDGKLVMPMVFPYVKKALVSLRSHKMANEKGAKLSI